MEFEEITLLGGPFDGDVHLVNPARNLLTIEYKTGATRKRLFGDYLADVVEIGCETYRRISPDTFEHCRTPGGIGDDNLDFYTEDE